MVGIGRAIVIRLVATRTGVRGIVVIAVVAGGTRIRNAGVGTVEHVIIIVNWKQGRRPASSCMAGFTVSWNTDRCVIGIGSSVKINRVAGCAFGWCSLESVRMAIDASRRQVHSREREGRCIVIKNHGGITGGVAGQAGLIQVDVAVHTGVFIVGSRIEVTIGAGYLHVVCRVTVAIRTNRPFPFVLAAVNREILIVVIKI